jgi:hypothetical protein
MEKTAPFLARFYGAVLPVKVLHSEAGYTVGNSTKHVKGENACVPKMACGKPVQTVEIRLR